MLRIAVMAAFAAFFVAPALASTVVIEKTTGLGTIRGVVRDDSGNPIADASVAIFRGGSSKLLKQVSSAADGSFLARIIPGTYTVLAVAQGFNPVRLLGVEVGRSADVVYGFKLERSGEGNTLPEKRFDKNSSKWRIRAAQSQRAIYQNREGRTGAVVAEQNGEPTENEPTKRRGTRVVETFVGETERGAYAGLNFATLLRVSDDTEVVLAGQTGLGNAPMHRFEAAVTTRLGDDHTVRVSTAGSKFTAFAVGKTEKALGQVSLQALDEWKIREGVILVYGFDYSRFLGAGNDSSLTPRIGVQYDLNAKTRIRTAFTAQTEERTWARAIELEGSSLAFAEPVAIDDLVVTNARPQLNKSRRLEFGIERVLDAASTIEANAFFDTTLGRGVGLNSVSFDPLGGDEFGAFVANQQGNARGARLVYTRRVNGLITASAGFSFGNGQRLSPDLLSGTSKIFENDRFQTFFAQVTTDLRSGTSIQTIYRLSPRATVFAIDPFKGRLAIYDPGLSILVTQSLPTLGLPLRAQAIVDARNILDAHFGVFGEDRGITLNSTRRMLRGGIQVRF